MWFNQEVFWESGTIDRVIRDTLTAEGYAITEATETAVYLQNLLAELTLAPATLLRTIGGAIP